MHMLIVEQLKKIYRKMRSERRARIRELLVRNGQSFIMLPPYEEKVKDNSLGGMQYYSQMNQDMCLDNCIFGNRRGGVFLDVGGNDPVQMNNTYFFEKNRGWTGVAFEPMPTAREKWKEKRTTECLPYALGNTEKQAEFCEYEADTLSGLASAVDYRGQIAKRYIVQTRRLDTILRERNINYVDFISLDVEGSELDVLMGIDFNAVYIYCIVIENNKGRKKEKEIRKFLTKSGFEIWGRLWIDDIWINTKRQTG